MRQTATRFMSLNPAPLNVGCLFLRILPNSASQPNQYGNRHFPTSLCSSAEKGISLPALLVPLLSPLCVFQIDQERYTVANAIAR